jgi:septal ring factor EnvC (AmiA/AmiB activator)
MDDKQNKRKILKKLKSRYRLFVINETNFQEKASLSLTPFNVLLVASAGLLIFSLISWGIFTLFPIIKDYSPGYNTGIDGKVKNEILKKLNKLETELNMTQKRELALKQIINGEEITAYDIPYKEDNSRKVELSINETKADGSRVKDAQQKIDRAQKTDQKPSEGKNGSVAENNLQEDFYREYDDLFFTPLKGEITQTFNIQNPYIEIKPISDETVKSVLDGTVIYKGWTPDFGYAIAIQHDNNWLSVYKYNLGLYKEVGSIVKAGETIGIIGYKENKKDIKKLRFELWRNGIAMNPNNLIVF